MAEPMYRQIADDLRRQIESGEFAPGAQLPTEIELRDQFDASRNTVRDAIKFLVTRGLVELRPGQGTFITEKIAPVTIRLGADPEGSLGEGSLYLPEVSSGQRFESSLPRVEIQEAAPLMLQLLRLPEGSMVVSRHQQRYLDSIPWSLQTSFYPMQLVARGATRLVSPEDIPSGTLQYFHEELGIQQVGWDERLAVRAPGDDEVGFFRLPADGRISVIESLRTGYDESGSPLRLTVTVYPADRNQFIVTGGQVPTSTVRVAEVPDIGKDRIVEARATAVVALER
jgi:GntR family transcriptional regulator